MTLISGLAQRGQGEEPIALLLENDAPMIAALLGVLKAGKIYVPLDSSLPRARMAYIIEHAGANLLISDTKNLPLARELTQNRVPLMNLDDGDPSLSVKNPGLPISPDALTWILYTSGSTGQPKGVVQNHRNVLQFIMNYTNGFHLCPEDRLTVLSSFSVNAGNHDIFTALLNGAALCLYNLKEEGVGNLANWLIQEEITIYFSIPIVFRQFVSTFTGQEKFPRLRLIQLGSDSVTLKEVEEYKKYLSPNTILVVRLGSTETGTLRRHFFDQETPLAEKMVPVGYAIEDMEVSLLDEEGKKVGFNRIGEIAVKSRYLSPGYWRRPDLTQAKFLPDPNGGDKRVYLTGDLGRMLPDGCLYHLGRKDFQVKVRGHRIEVAEIETALLSLASIKEAVVAPWEDQPGDQRLIAYLVANNRLAPSVSELRSFLKKKLPDYMIPSAFVVMDALPLLPNGKVDRRALPAPGRTRPELEVPLVLPRSPVEEGLAEIWAKTFGLDQIGIHDNFLDLGGHSLMATQIISRVIDKFRVELPVRSLLDAPTVAQMANVIAAHRGNSLSAEELERVLAGVESMTEEEAKKLLAAETRTGQD